LIAARNSQASKSRQHRDIELLVDAVADLKSKLVASTTTVVLGREALQHCDEDNQL
jgi:hypothetical protein